MQLSDEQQAALNGILAWLDRHEARYCTLGGLAGSGKTTVVSKLIEALEKLGVGYIVGAPTGKAASVLRSKGVPAATIHKLCYVCGGASKDGLMFEHVGISEKTGERPDLLICDEASMVSQQMFEDLTKKEGTRIVFVGDHGQLPPIGKDPGLMAKLDWELQTIHRQDGYLLELAHLFRQDQVLGKHLKAHPEIAAYHRMGTDAAIAAMREADVVLCYTNSQRHGVNLQELLRLHPEDFDHTEPGVLLPILQKVGIVPAICTMNAYDYGVMNGERGLLKVTSNADGEGLYTAEFRRDGEEEWLPVVCNARALFSDRGDVSFHDPGLKLDLAWAMTCHRAQGSEWDHVCVIDPGDFRGDNDLKRRWRYTAVTRAKKRLTWIGAR